MNMTARVGLFEVDAVLAVGIDRGFFREAGVELALQPVASSDAQFADLAAGRYHFIQTAFDNVANYALNTSNPLGRRLDVAAFMPVDYGMGLALVGRPGMDTTAGLRGKTVSVDSPISGYAYVVYALLERAAIDHDMDCAIVSQGAADRRLDDLLSGGADATLLTRELSQRAVEQGCHLLGTVADVCDPYLSSVLAASTARAGRDILLRVTAGYTNARSYALDPSHTREVITAMATVKGISGSAASALFEAALEPGGLVHDSRFDTHAIKNTLLLRQRYGGFDSPQDLDELSVTDSPLILDTI